MRNLVCGILLLAAFALANVPGASATDGHFLHGVGAINSAMGGAGIAAPESILGSFTLNPGSLMAFDGVRMELNIEMFLPDRSVSSSIGDFLSGSTKSEKSFVPIPAFGFSYKLPSERVVLGVAGVGTGGFGVNYPASAFGESANPILLPQPNGFGQVYSDYSLLKIAISAAWAPVDDLWFGVALNLDRAALAVVPFPAAAPNFDPDTETAFFSSAAATDSAFGIGFQVGVQYNVNDIFSFGASYTSEQWFQSFEWNSSNANPSLPDFGGPRTFSFKLNVPAIVGAGVAVQALPELLLAADFKYYFYEKTAGFEIPSTGPFNPDGSVVGFGWDNIYSLAFGLKYEPADIIALYGGYNFSDNPVPDRLSMINVPSPAIVQHHITLGVGIRPTNHFEITAAYYHAFENSGTGEILNPAIPPGTSSVTNTLKENSFLLQFSYASKGGI